MHFQWRLKPRARNHTELAPRGYVRRVASAVVDLRPALTPVEATNPLENSEIYNIYICIESIKTILKSASMGLGPWQMFQELCTDSFGI